MIPVSPNFNDAEEVGDIPDLQFIILWTSPFTSSSFSQFS
jgi:hypothetical protein